MGNQLVEKIDPSALFGDLSASASAAQRGPVAVGRSITRRAEFSGS
jgi:hypothetical protein